MEIFKILSSYFDYLFLQHEAVIYSSKIWGAKSGLLLLRTANLKIKLITDTRDGFYLEVGSLHDDDWVELSVLNSYLNSENRGKLKAAEAAKAFKEKIEKIEDVFSSHSATQRLLKFRKERAESRFN